MPRALISEEEDLKERIRKHLGIDKLEVVDSLTDSMHINFTLNNATMADFKTWRKPSWVSLRQIGAEKKIVVKGKPYAPNLAKAVCCVIIVICLLPIVGVIIKNLL